MFDDFKVKLDYGKAIIICDDDLNLDSYRSEIRPKIMILKTNPKKIYGLDSYDFIREYKSEIFKKAEESNPNIINITEMIREKMKKILEKELTKYFNENINNTDYITDFSVNTYSNFTTISFDFMREAIYFGRNVRNDEEAIKNIKIYINKLSDGIIKLGKDEYSYENFEYDIEKDEFSIEDKELIKKIYSERKLKLLLAYEQYKQGITPAIYNEIAKINNFLENKKSVTFELHNGTKIRAESNLSNILDIKDNGEIYIADRYTNKVIEGEPIDYCKCLATELKCLKYSKNELQINSDALKSLKTEETIIEKNEEEEEMM